MYRAQREGWREASTGGGGEEDGWRMLLSIHSHSPVELQSETGGDRGRGAQGGEKMLPLISRKTQRHQRLKPLKRH